MINTPIFVQRRKSSTSTSKVTITKTTRSLQCLMFGYVSLCTGTLSITIRSVSSLISRTPRVSCCTMHMPSLSTTTTSFSAYTSNVQFSLSTCRTSLRSVISSYSSTFSIKFLAKSLIITTSSTTSINVATSTMINSTT